MKRRVFNILSAVSLVMAVAVAGLWVRSYWRIDFWQVTVPGSTQIGCSAKGQTAVLFADGNGWLFSHASNDDLSNFDATGGDFYCLGFRFNRSVLGVEWGVPHWFLIILLLLLSSWWEVRRRNQAKIELHCPSCGYDLRASKDNCPECGAAIPTPSP